MEVKNLGGDFTLKMDKILTDLTSLASDRQLFSDSGRLTHYRYTRNFVRKNPRQ